MTEFSAPTPETQESEVTRQQREALRGYVAERVSTEPLSEEAAERAIEDFGLETGAYEVFGDTVSEFSGGFKRFVPKDDESGVLEGMTYAHVGGSVNNLNRSMHNMLLKPNGDLIGRITTENDEGTKVTKVSWPAANPDPDAAGAYERHISAMFTKAAAMMKEKSAVPERNGQMAPEVWAQPQHVAKRGRGLLDLFRR